MPGFTKEEEAFIETVAWRVSEKISERLSERIEERITAHQDGCPHGRRIGRIALVCTAIGTVLGFLGRWAWAKATGG